jgi:hypothetical protein
LKEEHGLRVSKNGVLRKIFGFRSKVVIMGLEKAACWGAL